MKKLSPLLITILFIFSCTVINKIPEVTPEINAEKFKEISLSPTIFSILSDDDRLILSDLQGSINSIFPESRKSSILLNTENRFRKNIFFQNGIIVLNTLKNKKHILIDLNTDTIIYESKRPSGKRIIGVDKEHLIYLSKRSINIFNYQKNRTLFSTETDQGEIVNCEISDNKVFILFENSLLIYDLLQNVSNLKSIKAPPASPFLKIKNNIFYGDKDRNLINFSINKNKIIWKYKFQKMLINKPFFHDGTLIVNPEDNNTYFITMRGGLKQWYRSDYARRFNPVLMKDHLAVFQRVEEGTSINYYGIRKNTMSNFRDKSLILKLPPVYYNGDLYSIGSEKDDPELKLIKIGNKFGSKIKIEPKNNHEIGKSIRFTISPVNIIKPEIIAEVFNEKKEKVFSKIFQYNQLSSFSWVPGTEGKFSLNVITKDEKGVIRTDIKDLIVTDTGQMYKKLQMKLHRKCGLKNEISEKKNEQKDKKLPY